jgi:beta-phosphoglucomutase-like phosphatase (HAD superfamily)
VVGQALPPANAFQPRLPTFESRSPATAPRNTNPINSSSCNKFPISNGFVPHHRRLSRLALFLHFFAALPGPPMNPIEAILFEPVGCLAEFPAAPFLEIAARFFDPRKRDRRQPPSQSGSRSYWHLLNLIEAAGPSQNEANRAAIEDLEVQAAAAAVVYEDVVPALSELQGMGIKLLFASSLSRRAVARFLHGSLRECFWAVWDRDTSGGIKAAPLSRALAAASLPPERAMFLADTAEALKVARSLGVNAFLMMNDPDEARRLALHNPAGGPAGGIVSLHELPDFLRLVLAQKAAAEKAAGLPLLDSQGST